MNDARYRRVKHGDLLGDVSKRCKIAMRELRVPVQVFPWQWLDRKAAKAYNRVTIRGGEKVNRRRAYREIRQALEDMRRG